MARACLRMRGACKRRALPQVIPGMLGCCGADGGGQNCQAHSSRLGLGRAALAWAVVLLVSPGIVVSVDGPLCAVVWRWWVSPRGCVE